MIAHSEKLDMQAAFICVLSEALQYETPQLAYEAYYLANMNQKKTIQEVGIKLSGLWLPRDMKTCSDLVDEIDFRVGMIGLGIEYFIEVIQSKHKLLVCPDQSTFYRA